MADELRVLERPALRRPVLVAAFRGWNDGGQGASLAGAFLARTWGAERFAEIDPERFFDFQSTRPHVSLVDGLTRRIDWPENAFHHAQLDGSRRDVVLLLGTEPSLRWRTFAELVIGLAHRSRRLDGGHARLAARRRPAHAARAGDRERDRPRAARASSGSQASRYEGPTGIVGVLHDACREAGIPSVSLWAAVPHYVSLTPSPARGEGAVRAARASCSTAELDTPSSTRRARPTSSR